MIRVFSLNESEEWDSIVRSFDKHDVYYLSGYVHGFERNGDGIPLLVLYQDGTGRAINVLMKRDIADDQRFSGKLQHGVYFDLITPYGYGGWLIENIDDLTILFEEYEQWCISEGIVSEFVRFHPVIRNEERLKQWYEVIPLGETVCMDLTDKDTIWDNLTCKNRNMVRKAEKNDISVVTGRSAEMFDAFKKIYEMTMDKDNASPYYYFPQAYYDSVREKLSTNSLVFSAMLDGEIIASSIIIWSNGMLNYHLSGSLRDYQNLAPTNLILVKAAEWGAEHGCRTFHLGGGVGSSEDGLLRFKKSFYRGELCRFHIGKKIHMEDRYRELLALRGDIPDSGFFPKYRA